jgi:hypothetical protein
MREPRCSLVNIRWRRRPRIVWGKPATMERSAGRLHVPSGVSGTTRLEGGATELERSTEGTVEGAYRQRRLKGVGLPGKSDEPIVAKNRRSKTPGSQGARPVTVGL